MKDRYDGSGGMFTEQALIENRSWCLSQVRLYFNKLEKLLQDGRDWILGGTRPSLAEVHAGWVPDWALNMASDMRDDAGDLADIKRVLSKEEFPRTHAWIERWREVTKDAESSHLMAEGKEAEDTVVHRILDVGFVEKEHLDFDEDDVLGLKRGQIVSISPVDFGFTHEDRGVVVGLTKDEVVIEVEVPGGKDGKLRLHYPRINFKIKPAE